MDSTPDLVDCVRSERGLTVLLFRQSGRSAPFVVRLMSGVKLLKPLERSYGDLTMRRCPVKGE